MRKVILVLFSTIFLYGSTSQVEVQLTVADNNLDWVNLQYPAEGSIRIGANYDVYSRVYEPGVTNVKVKEVISKHGLDTQAQTQTRVVMVGSGSLQIIILMQIIMMNTKLILELLSHQQEHTIMQVGFLLMVV